MGLQEWAELVNEDKRNIWKEYQLCTELKGAYILIFGVDEAPFMFEFIAYILNELECKASWSIFQFRKYRLREFELSFHF